MSTNFSTKMNHPKSLMEVVSSSYWSSTTDDYDTRHAWIVNFGGGDKHNYFRLGSSYVRAVRAGQ